MASRARAMHASSGWLALVAAVVLAALALAIPSRATAGEFTIEACQAISPAPPSKTSLPGVWSGGAPVTRSARGCEASSPPTSCAAAVSLTAPSPPSSSTPLPVRLSRGCAGPAMLSDATAATRCSSTPNARTALTPRSRTCVPTNDAPLGDAAQAASWPRPRSRTRSGADQRRALPDLPCRRRRMRERGPAGGLDHPDRRLENSGARRMGIAALARRRRRKPAA
jgi:hypothetical protein